MFLDYFALFLVFFVVIFMFYGIIVIHDIPYEIAQHRNHPHQDAIHVAGWVSLFTLHVIWPFLWIWAYLYDEKKGWGFQSKHQSLISSDGNIEVTHQAQQIEQLTLQVEQLTEQVNKLSQNNAKAE